MHSGGFQSGIQVARFSRIAFSRLRGSTFNMPSRPATTTSATCRALPSLSLYSRTASRPSKHRRALADHVRRSLRRGAVDGDAVPRGALDGFAVLALPLPGGRKAERCGLPAVRQSSDIGVLATAKKCAYSLKSAGPPAIKCMTGHLALRCVKPRFLRFATALRVTRHNPRCNGLSVAGRGLPTVVAGFVPVIRHGGSMPIGVLTH